MKNNIETIRHTLAHVMAYAVKQLYPDVKFGIGPIIENGFYYDFDLDHTLNSDDFPKIEKIMQEIISNKIEVEHRYIPIDEAIEEARSSGQNYKVELLEDIKSGKRIATTDEDIEQQKDGKISFYTIDGFTDLCKGPHVKNTGDLPKDGFKLISVAGAYWRGSEKNPQMQRVYSVAFITKKELDNYLVMLGEAEKRDHKKIGKELGLFAFSPLVGSGLPLFLSKGEIIFHELEKFMRIEKESLGYKFVHIPHIAKAELYKKSGHFGKYDAMMPIMTDQDGNQFVMKAMNCPHHFAIYNAEPHSYRDLPYRIAETTTVYRNEKSGELSGLVRVKSVTQDDTHHFVRHDQIQSEIEMILGLTDRIYRTFNLTDYSVQVSIRDPKHLENYFGDDKIWKKSEEILVEAVKKWGRPYVIKEGEAAFYGPKIDIMVKDSIGRNWQLTTVQLDFNQSENFNMRYVGEDGQEHAPAVLHVAILGAIERFMGVLIEHYAGAFPTWLAPVQVAILPITEKQNKWANDIYKELSKSGIHTEINLDNETLGKKIRQAELQKIPYLLVIGDKEVKSKAVAVRQRNKGDIGQMPLEEFVEKIKSEIRDKK